jgi:ornithine cyclodeaminase/alanine dehydrogenase
MTLLLARDDVARVLGMPDCIDAVERAFGELTAGTAELPLRIGIRPPGGISLYMPAYLKGLGALACKVVTVYKDNPTKHGIPTTIGKVLLQDPETGDVTCIMDGGYLTAMRTGAVSGVATKYLARENDGQVAGIFGAGVQARMQLRAVAAVRKLGCAVVYDPVDEAVAGFVEALGGDLGLEIDRVASPEELLEASDIVCAATSSPTPLFDGATVRPGTHINGIGSHTPTARELDTATIVRSRVIADQADACLSEAGDLMIPIEEGAISADHIAADLGELVLGRKPGRENDEQITLFKSVGLAIQDAATAKLVYDKAVEAGIGTEVSL